MSDRQHFRFELIQEFLSLVWLKLDGFLNSRLLAIITIQVLNDLHSGKGLAEVSLAVSLAIEGRATPDEGLLARVRFRSFRLGVLIRLPALSYDTHTIFIKFLDKEIDCRADCDIFIERLQVIIWVHHVLDIR